MLEPADRHPNAKNLPGADVAVSRLSQLDILIEGLHATECASRTLEIRSSTLYYAGPELTRRGAPLPADRLRTPCESNRESRRREPACPRSRSVWRFHS